MARDCSRTTTLIVTGGTLPPLDDLGHSQYSSTEGGLYPDGYNDRPAGHTQAGLKLAETVRDNPLDTDGSTDTDDGVILFMSLGGTSCKREWAALTDTPIADYVNPKVRFFNAATAGVNIEDMDTTADAYWATTLEAALQADGYELAQVRVVLFENDYGTPPVTQTFPSYPNEMAVDLGDVMRALYTKCPNVKMAYCTSRIYGGYSDDVDYTEPLAWYGGWAVKTMIEGQLLGDTTLIYDADIGTVTVPWLSWLAYTWADGVNQRNDGLHWICNDFDTNDGYHPSVMGQYAVADMWMDALLRDETVRTWLLKEKGR